VKLSAGLLPYRHQQRLEVLIAHPGGPLWANRDVGHWGLIKGEVSAGEDPIAAAVREFSEETGWNPPIDGWLDLGSVTLRSGKVVMGWAVEADFDPDELRPGLFTMVWRGRRQEFPEIDRVRWCAHDEATRLVNPAQVPLIDRLVKGLVS
jgi:predicted NUDIX family NTP pyrophosphohydrolase